MIPDTMPETLTEPDGPPEPRTPEEMLADVTIHAAAAKAGRQAPPRHRRGQ